MQVDGTNISQAIYCNAMNKGNFYYNMLSVQLLRAELPHQPHRGHLQPGKSGVHQLHHVQNVAGPGKCEYCGKDCSGAKTACSASTTTALPAGSS